MNYDEFLDTDGIPQDHSIKQLSDLISDLNVAERRVQDLEEELKDAKDAARELAERQIPELMQELGFEEFKTTDGVKVALKEKITVSPKKDNRPLVYDWLRERGHDNLIKQMVSVPFNRGEQDKATKLVRLLEEMQLPIKQDYTVAPATLRKFVIDRLKEGEEIPMDLFGVYQYRTVKIVDSKPKAVFDGE